MTAGVAQRPKVFAVHFQETLRWDPLSFHHISWHWPPRVMVPIGEVLSPRKEKVDRASNDFTDLMPITIHFDGSVEPRSVDASREYTMTLYWARPGDIVVSKIDLKNGAVAIIPGHWENAVVTSHFAVYRPDTGRMAPEFFHLLIQARFFRDYLWQNKVGAEGRKEVKLDFFESIEIPLPPLPVQQAIVRHWQEAWECADGLLANAEEEAKGIPRVLLAALDVPQRDRPRARSRILAPQWRDLNRWSFRFVSRKTRGLDGFDVSKYPIHKLGEFVESTLNGFCQKPAKKPTPTKTLKLNALGTAGLDPDQSKFVDVPQDVVERFDLCAGDILICRSIGSFDMVAKTVLVPEDLPGFIFPDIIIRVRLHTDEIVPAYAREILECELGRQYFQTRARTAVGMWKIGSSDILAFPCPVPPLDIQRDLVAEIESKRAESARLKAEAEELRERTRREVEEMILGVRPVEGL